MIDVFLYGSLQPGAWNDRYLPPGSVTEPATAQGSVYYFSHNSYPVGVFNRGGSVGRVHGTLLAIDEDSESWYNIKRLELSSGYTLASLAVKTPTRHYVHSLVFEWIGMVNDALHIPSGDWFSDYFSNRGGR